MKNKRHFFKPVPTCLFLATQALFLPGLVQAQVGQVIEIKTTVNHFVLGNGDKNDNGKETLPLVAPNNNTVTVTGEGEVMGWIAGAYVNQESGPNEAFGNVVELQSGASVSSSISGAAISSGVVGPVEASSNTVRITDGTDIQSVFGARPWNALYSVKANENAVDLIGGRFLGQVKGASIRSDSEDGSAEATNNRVTISGGTFEGDVYGAEAYGSASLIETKGNNVNIGNEASIDSSVYGGYANAYGSSTGSAISAIENEVTVTESQVDDSVYGGAAYSDSGSATASGNKLTFNNASVLYEVFGGYADSDENGAVTASNNEIVITGGEFGDWIIGGGAQSDSGSATASGNKLTFNNASVLDEVYGGYAYSSGSASASDNKLTFNNASVLDEVYGAYARSYGGSSTASSNQVSITGGELASGLIGAWASSGSDFMVLVADAVAELATGGTATADANTVSVENATVNYGVAGGAAISQAGLASASGNTVNLLNATINGLVYGGRALSSEGGLARANNNRVNINGGTIEGDVYAGVALSNNNISATHNTVTISGTPVLNGALFGGSGDLDIAPVSTGLSDDGGLAVAADAPTVDVFSGNTLNLKTAGITVNGLYNFENLNFYLPSSFAAGDTMLTVAGEARLSENADGTGRQATVNVGIQGGSSPLKVADTVVLIDAKTLTGTPANTSSSGQGMQGISLLYDFDITTKDNQLLATVTAQDDSGGDSGGNGSVAARVNPQLKSLSEGFMAGAMLVTRGADLIAYDAFNAIRAQNGGLGLKPFIMMAGSHSRYDSGSHIKSNDFLLAGGLSYQNKNLMAGAFLEAGWGNYDSFNSFTNAADVNGDGHSRYFGAGLLGRYEFNNGLYADASVRFGQNRNRFEADFGNPITGDKAKYRVKNSYTSAHIGGGYVLPLSAKSDLDLSAKYLWTRLSDKDVTLGGDPIHFKAVNSNRLRINADYNHYYSDSVTLNAGLGYEHEFSGRAKATTYGIYDIDTVSVKGGTGILSLGVTVKPDSKQNLSLSLKANGYAGKRQGVGASVKVSYAF